MSPCMTQLHHAVGEAFLVNDGRVVEPPDRLDKSFVDI